MKTLDNTNLGYLLTKIKNAFIRNTDVIEATEVSIDSTPTENSDNLVTSGGVHTSMSGKQDTIDSSHKLSADLVEDGTTNKVYTSTEQTKLSGIEAGAQVNVKPDWNAASGSDAEILNKPTIPDAVSGTNDGTNWTTITIGSVTKAIPSGGGGSSTLAGLTDVDVSNPSDGQVLTYDNANREWKNTTQYAAVLRTWTNS